MQKKNRHLCSHNQVLNTFFLPLVFTTVLFIITTRFMSLPLSKIPSGFWISAISNSVPAFHTEKEIQFRFSAYDILENSLLSIKASEAMKKKYAARYGGITKTIKNSVTQQNEPIITDNILETDLSTSGIQFINTPGVAVDANALLQQSLGFYPQDGAPRVLIVHTHTSEAYADSPDARSTDPDRNVVSVGTAIKKSLEKAGIGVIHDTTENDNPSYNQSYKKALKVIEDNLTRYPTLEVVLDIHRDYIKRDDGTLTKPTCITKNGQKAAQIMFVIGTDSMGLYHPKWTHNLAFAVQIQNRLQTTTPGLCRSINIRTERFNQHATKGSMIIEVGTGVNTQKEAELSGKLVGEAIADILLAQ